MGQGYSAHLIHIDVNVCSLAVVIADFVALYLMNMNMHNHDVRVQCAPKCSYTFRLLYHPYVNTDLCLVLCKQELYYAYHTSVVRLVHFNAALWLMFQWLKAVQ